jgi:predicted HAD superfamily phosphohydrolase YqeG
MILLGSGIETFEEHTTRTKGDEINPEMIAHGLSLIFKPELTKTAMEVGKILNLPVDEICANYRGLLLGVEGTIMEQGGEIIDPDIADLLLEIKSKIRICAMTNCSKPNPALIHLGIPIARNIPPMPDARGFSVAVAQHLQNPGSRNNVVLNSQCAMIGSNPLTEGGCTRAGIDFISVQPMPGSESTAFKVLRQAGRSIAAIHDIGRADNREQSRTKKA